MVLAAGMWAVNAIDRPIRIDAGHLVYDLSRGTTINSLASDLSRREIIATPSLVFRLYARLTRSEGRLKAGEYRLDPGMTSRSLLVMFRAGKVIQRQVTFVEGWTFADWRRMLSAQQGLEQTIRDKTGAQVMALLGEPDVAPEGEFFPDTYHYTRGETDLSILERAHRRMVETLAREWHEGSDAVAFSSPYQALILASIVEKETGYEPDRPKVARVFINRLAKHMKLQSDPTIIYGLKDFNGDLTRADLKADTPYNTYTAFGLPPTPICNPGLDAIHATLNPDPGDFYYFVARGDGSSEFSRTLKEHNDAVARFQKAGRVEDYRSAPVGK
ncbi:MAG TPA: endolytic transglycosylase MltG [Pseudomonadales bacterium]|nr:endolytic transglycosylase MltG [Pseudomonadales bacterium]